MENEEVLITMVGEYGWLMPIFSVHKRDLKKMKQITEIWSKTSYEGSIFDLIEKEHIWYKKYPQELILL